jgi:hypothetical protein
MVHAPIPHADGPSPVDPRTQARAVFGRVLSSWALDLLELRRRGMDRPSHRRGAWSIAGQVTTPTTEGTAGTSPAEAA